jgi:hypothetical protein
MPSTTTQVTNYINSTRVGIADYINKVCLKEKLGHNDLFCQRQKVMLLSGLLDCVVDYFQPFLDGEPTYSDNNFFETTDEIRSVIEHINSICNTFYTLDL